MKMKRLFKAGLILMTFLGVCSCNASSRISDSSNVTDSSFVETKEEALAESVVDSNKIHSIINDKIASLPEFKKLLQYNERDGNVSVSVVKGPHSDFKYYWVQVGRDHPDRFEPIYNFYVTPGTYDILYYDTEGDTTLTLKQWREKKKVTVNQ